MRTNIDIDDELMESAMNLSGNNTKKKVVEEALKEYIAMHRRRDLLNFRGRLKWEGDLDTMRETG